MSHIKTVCSTAFFFSSALVDGINLWNVAPNIASSLTADLWILAIWAFLLIAEAWAICKGGDTQVSAFTDVSCAAVTFGFAFAFKGTEYFSITALLASVIRAVLESWFANALLVVKNFVGFKFTAFLFGGAVFLLLTVDLVFRDEGVCADFASLVFLCGYASMGNGAPHFFRFIAALLNGGTFFFNWAE